MLWASDHWKNLRAHSKFQATTGFGKISNRMTDCHNLLIVFELFSCATSIQTQCLMVNIPLLQCAIWQPASIRPSLMDEHYCQPAKARRWSHSHSRMVWWLRCAQAAPNQRLNIMRKCAQSRRRSELARSFASAHRNWLSSFFFLLISRNWESLRTTLKEMIDATVLELLEPEKNKIIPQSQ